ncbi:phage tail sheath subtilisin-like domain-containing protein [Microcoleus sp. Pol11C2]|uniref:phage tail sheath subtilisin-like domain-containing protein n=1 Tax=Microcoleus sp. Pol11C2 TaxID=3055389 RepID=UPI002FD59962
MTTYLSPGIYVKEVLSGAVSIAGVGTSTAGFIGMISHENSPSTGVVLEAAKLIPVQLGGTEVTATTGNVTDAPSVTSPSTTDSHYRFQKVVGEVVGKGDGKKTEFILSSYPTDLTVTNLKIKLGNQEQTSPAFTVNNDPHKQVSTLKFITAPATDQQITVDYYPVSVAAGKVQLCTNFTEFKKYFGDFPIVTEQSNDAGRSNLAHAVYGFFRNGGTRCFVTWVANEPNIDGALEDFAAIDEIAIVAAPGSTNNAVLEKLSSHCKMLGDRVAIFDAPQDMTSSKPGEGGMPGGSDYAALYYPWIQVLDPATNKKQYVPPSGHIAGIYARVDAQRGVHKAPANEAILGAIGLQVALTRVKQDGLNPQGVNCIRNLNGNILVWGARTWGGDINGEFKYVNIRRLFNYLRESIDEGSQWVVFEPNSPELWARVRRSVTAFLTMVWRSGALFGATPEEAFFVQCDEETNPPEVRDAGQLIVKIGVAVVKPAEFVIFELSQWSGGK